MKEAGQAVAEDTKEQKESAVERVLFFIILALAIGIRFYQLGIVPGNGVVNGDEAFAGYEAFSLYQYGYDTSGNPYPVYFDSMNVLESYLMIPFIALFGLTNLAIRLPMAIFGVLTVLAFYGILRDGIDRKEALAGMFLMAIVPWNVMLSRWGLESNMYPAFMLFGTFFFQKGIKNSKWIIPSMICFGFSLYGYAAPWTVMPLIIGGYCVYAVVRCKTHIDRYWIIGICSLAVIALPLILFVAINMGIIPEIITPFISIPKLPRFRGNEVGIHGIFQHLYKLFRVVILQKDDMVWNCARHVGIYYYISIIPMLVGIYALFKEYRVKEEKNCTLNSVMLIWLAGAIILGLMIDNNVNRINIVHIPVLYLCVKGIFKLISMGKEEKTRKAVGIAILTAYLAYFGYFCIYYFGEFSKRFAEVNGEGLAEAITYAKEREPESIYVDWGYQAILYYTEMPVDYFVNIRTLEDSDQVFGQYKIGSFLDEEVLEDVVYIGLDNEETWNYFEENRMETVKFECFVVGYK